MSDCHDTNTSATKDQCSEGPKKPDQQSDCYVGIGQ